MSDLFAPAPTPFPCAPGTSERVLFSGRVVSGWKQPHELALHRRILMLTMNPFNPLSLVLGLALLVIGVLATVALARMYRARRRATRRVVEQPNSHYVSQLVREHETRHRWHDIDLGRVHEINRGEVVRLLAKVEAGGSEALRENERTFLDYMAELTRGSPPAAAEPVRDDDAPSAPALRHRSA